MTLFFEDTRRVGAIGVIVSLLACLAFVFFRWPSPPASYFWGVLCLGCGVFYLYLASLRRRRVVTLLDDELVWNTSSLSTPPESVRVSEIRVYRVEPIHDTHLYRGSILLGSSAWRDVGGFPLDVHRRIFSAIAALNPTLTWQRSDQ